MNRLSFVAAATAAFVSTGALAADLSLATPVSAYNWSGFYAGVHGGFGGDKFTYPFSIAFPPDSASGNLTLNSSGFYGGGQVGYNWQFAPQWVAGVEADINASGIEGKLGIDVSATDGTDTVNINGSAGSKVDYFGTVRGRIGFAANSALFYATGGLAWGHNELGGSAGALGISDDKMHIGWTVGAGFEYAFAPQWSAKVEYLYTQYGSENYFGAIIPGGIDLEPETHSVKVGINYRFN